MAQKRCADCHCPCEPKQRILDVSLTNGNTGGSLPDLWAWCVKNGMVISPKVKISENCIHRYGMIAVESINQSETLFEIPRTLFLWEENNSYNSDLHGLSQLKSKSGWVKLLLVLMLEYTGKNLSKWAPYMQFAPDTDVLDTPIFWPVDIRNKLLSGTALFDLVNDDIKNIEKEYFEIALPYIENNSKLGFEKSLHTLELYMRMAGFVMAYSFTDPADDDNGSENPPKMVPMADVLNHICKNNANLQFDEKSWKMVATRDIAPGCEVFNTFGFLSNSQLLQMYGFVEKGSSSDTVEIPVSLFKECSHVVSIEEKWKYLFDKDVGVMAECEVITIGTKGILSCDEAELLLKIFSLSMDEFQAYNGEEWESSSESSSSGDSDDSVYAITYEKVKCFDSSKKSSLQFAGELYRDQLMARVQEKKNMSFDSKQDENRKEKIVMLLYGQILILNTLLNACA